MRGRGGAAPGLGRLCCAPVVGGGHSPRCPKDRRGRSSAVATRVTGGTDDSPMSHGVLRARPPVPRWGDVGRIRPVSAIEVR